MKQVVLTVHTLKLILHSNLLNFEYLSEAASSCGSTDTGVTAGLDGT